MKFKNIINVENIDMEDWSLGEVYKGKSAEVATKLNSTKLGFHIEILSPKKYSCPYHYHDTEEELFYVIDGEATLRQNESYRKIKKGDLIWFGLGEEYSHQFYNHTDEDFKFIAISNLDKADAAYFPDSGKVYIRRTGEVFKQDDKVPYITDEEDPSIYWKK